MTDWQDINTAPISPEDGPEIAFLAWVSDGGTKGDGCCAFAWRTYRGKIRASGFWGDYTVTHWMPLPSEPTNIKPSKKGVTEETE